MRSRRNVTGPIAAKWDAGWTHGFQMSWSYTGRGEIDLTKTRLLDGSGQPTGSWVSSWERDWNWDDVSNRTFEDHVDDQQDRTYSANSLNQYNWYEEDEHQYNFNHDDDGNLTGDGTWSYTYDLEDRVIGMSKSGITLSFTYDYLGRRVRKVASGGAYPGTYEYVYDGFNEIAIYRNDARMGSYTWGLDKTGTLHGAGGVGGLLMVRGTNPSFPLMDARGNVTGLLDGSGNIYRAYQFDAFGNAVGYKLNTGVQSMDFIGFASNFTDIESGLVDFGMRLYQPKHGRFIHRDPIGEAGGENLYAHTWNDPVNRWDLLGMIDPDEQDRLAREQDIFLWDTFSQNRDTMMEPGFEYHFSYQQGAGQAMADHLAILRDTPQGFFKMGGQQFAVNIFGEVLINDNGTARLMTGWSWQRGSPSMAQSEQAGGSKVGDFLRNKVPYFGGLLGALGDTISGAVNTVAGIGTLGGSGTFGRGISQLKSGVGNTIDITIRDAFAGGVGLVGTVVSTGSWIGSGFNDLRNGNLKGFGTKIGAMVGDLFVPEYGWWNGWNWGAPQFGSNSSNPKPINQGDHAGFIHDDQMNDGDWINRYQFNSSEYTPNGIIGGVYGILGTPIFKILDRK